MSFSFADSYIFVPQYVDSVFVHTMLTPCSLAAIYFPPVVLPWKENYICIADAGIVLTMSNNYYTVGLFSLFGYFIWLILPNYPRF